MEDCVQFDLWKSIDNTYISCAFWGIQSDMVGLIDPLYTCYRKNANHYTEEVGLCPGWTNLVTNTNEWLEYTDDEDCKSQCQNLNTCVQFALW